jgi:probable HAF family extracellular repeat protein
MTFERWSANGLIRPAKWPAFVLGAVIFVLPAPLLSGQATRAGCVAPRYKVIELPLRPAAINDAGQVAGTTSHHRAAMWTQRNGLREFELPAGFQNSEGVAINSSGHLLDIAYDQTFKKHESFIFANGVLTLLTGKQTRGYDINNAGVVAGESLIDDREISQPVLWSDNSIRSLGGCCGGSSKGVNATGEAIGDAYDAEGRYHAFYWTAGSGIQLIGPPDRYSSAIAINSRGDVVVQSFPEIFLYSAGKLTRLFLSPKYTNHPRAINDCGVVVGSFGPHSDADRAFVWEKSVGFQDLNARIPIDSGWKLESAVSISNRGEIVGSGDFKGDDNRGFLLVPTP